MTIASHQPPRTMQVVEMPGWRPIARQVGTTLVTVSLLPMAVFTRQ